MLAALAVGHLAIAAQSVGPAYLFDEVGYLAGAQVFADPSATWALCGDGYAVGYSAILAPLWWIFGDPATVYQAAAYLSALIGALVMLPASALARRFGASGGLALAIGAIVTIAPTRALMDNYVLAENPLTLLVVTSAVLAWDVARRGGRWRTVLLGAAVGASVLVHSRALPLAAITLAWLIVRAVSSDGARRRVALVGTIPIVALAIAGIALQGWMTDRVFADGSQADKLASSLGSTSPGALAHVVLGQWFYQGVAWSVLTTLGVGVLIVAVSKGKRTAGLARVAVGARAWLLAVVVGQAAFFVWILAASADVGTRLDIPIYGRYLDPFVVPLAVLGACAIARRRGGRLVTVASLSVVLASLTYAVLVVPTLAPRAPWIPFAIPGLAPYLDIAAGDPRPGLYLAGVLTIAGAFAVWALRRWPRAVLAALIVGFAGATTFADFARIDPFESGTRATTRYPGIYEAIGNEPVSLARSELPCFENNKIQFDLADRPLLILNTPGAIETRYVIGAAKWPTLESAGGVRVPFTVWENSALWLIAANEG